MEDDSTQGHPSPKTVPSKPAQVRMISYSASEESLKQRRDGRNSSVTTSNDASSSDVTVIAPPRDLHPGHSRDSSPASARKDSHPSASHDRTISHSGLGTSETNAAKRTGTKGGKGDHSPPLTGKDSAYSSVSGGSFASPTAAHPRSASAQSSYPRAQFGLFPSSTPGTPKPSMSGRHGAMSPAFPSPRHPEQPAYYPPPRAQSSLDNHNPSRRMSKKSSLSSLKRLFTKKRHGSVDTIME
jgi:hypothetical protein